MNDLSIKLLVVLLNALLKIWPVVLLFAITLVVWYHYFTGPQDPSGNRLSFLIMLLILSPYILALIRWWIATPYIVRWGHHVPALIVDTRIKSDPDKAENREIYFYQLAFKGVDGKPYQRTSFESRYGSAPSRSDSTPTYPKAMFLRYPKVGEAFEVAYLPGLEKYAVILNTGDSEFAQAIQEEHKQKMVRQLEHREERAKRLLDLDPNNQELQKIYQQAQQDLYDYWQFDKAPVLKEKINGTLYF